MIGKIIVAYDSTGGIGKDGRIPWHVPEDMQFFKRETMSEKNAVVMGYKTWLSLNCKPLAGRVNVVLTQNHRGDIGHDIDIIIAKSMDDAWAHLQRMPNIEKVFAIGGCQVYKAALEHPGFVECIVTHIHPSDCEFQCDTFFPMADAIERGWHVQQMAAEQQNSGFTIVRYGRCGQAHASGAL